MIVGLETARPLAPLTSLALGGPAEYFVEARTRDAIAEACAYAQKNALALHILGGGSNLIVADAGVRGLVLRIATRGIDLRADSDTVLLTAEAGEPFENVVEHALAHDLAGLECLTGIPGSTGATPLQNVGAYGQEVADTIDAVEVLDSDTGRVSWLSNRACGFTYRSSRFKREATRALVLSVRFRLRPGAPPQLRYAELQRAFATNVRPSLRDVSDTVRRLRAQKSMLLDTRDPNGRSAGSFFTNPVLTTAEASALCTRAVQSGRATHAQEVPIFPADPGYSKVSAGWLIERAGIVRGLRLGHVGVSSAHALCLVHHGGGTTAELIALAERIEDAVKQAFSVSLVREPVIWGELSAACANPPDHA